ncbi:MAG: tetratricopeptide repeat protein, partial [Candidatus Limnocylindria bacterium]
PPVAALRAAPGAGRRAPVVLGAVMAALLLLGFALPAPFGTAMRTETNQSLADAIAREEGRRQQIADLLVRLEADPRDGAVLSDLADAYLAGGGAEDRRRGAAALLALIALEPGNESAYRRLITAYLNAGDWTDARAATDAYARVADRDDPDIPFFRGLIALRGAGDEREAIRQFDRFLELAPDDPRAAMIRGLRAEAAGEDG